MTQGVVDQQLAGTASSTATTTKYVYSFGDGRADGNGKMKDVLGGKGAGLAEMTLEFHDGALQVSPSAVPRKGARPARVPPTDPPGRQGDLF